MRPLPMPCSMPPRSACGTCRSGSRSCADNDSTTVAAKISYGRSAVLNLSEADPMLRKFPALLLLLSAGATQAAEHFDGTTWWNTVKVLADDKFEGRETGSEGERQAQAYIVGRLKA